MRMDDFEILSPERNATMEQPALIHHRAAGHTPHVLRRGAEGRAPATEVGS